MVSILLPSFVVMLLIYLLALVSLSMIIKHYILVLIMMGKSILMVLISSFKVDLLDQLIFEVPL